MLVDISDVMSAENREVTKEVLFGHDSFKSRLGEFPITKKTPITLRIANRENKRLLISGEVAMTVRIPCNRCLEDVETDIRFTVDKELTAEGAEINDGETEAADYLSGTWLDTDKLVYEEILVHWPVKVLCREDCKGICKVCGMNLNRGSCDCRKTEPDPRMAAIQDVFSKFKEV